MEFIERQPQHVKCPQIIVLPDEWEILWPAGKANPRFFTQNKQIKKEWFSDHIPALKARMPTGLSTTSGAASAPATSWVSCSGPWGKFLICHSSNHHRYCPHNHRCLFQTHLSPGQGCLQELPDLASRRRREKREKVSFSYYDGREISLQVTKYVTTSKPLTLTNWQGSKTNLLHSMCGKTWKSNICWIERGGKGGCLSLIRVIPGCCALLSYCNDQFHTLTFR